MVPLRRREANQGHSARSEIEGRKAGNTSTMCLPVMITRARDRSGERCTLDLCHLESSGRCFVARTNEAPLIRSNASSPPMSKSVTAHRFAADTADASIRSSGLRRRHALYVGDVVCGVCRGGRYYVGQEGETSRHPVRIVIDHAA